MLALLRAECQPTRRGASRAWRVRREHLRPVPATSNRDCRERYGRLLRSAHLAEPPLELLAWVIELLSWDLPPPVLLDGSTGRTQSDNRTVALVSLCLSARGGAAIYAGGGRL